MGFILWIVAALLVAGIFVYLSSLRTRRLLPKIDLPPGEKMPRTPLQRLAGWTLLVVCLLTGTAASMVAYHGAQVWWESDPVIQLPSGTLRRVLTGHSTTAMVPFSADHVQV